MNTNSSRFQISSFETINDLANSIDKSFERNKVDTYEDKISLHNMNLNMNTNSSRFQISSFETINAINELARSNDSSLEKILNHNLELNIITNPYRFTNSIRFQIDTNIQSSTLENENLLQLNESIITSKNLLMIKTVGSTIQENELIKEFNSELNKEIKKEIDIDIENKEKMVDTSILTKIQIINMIYKESYKNKFVTGFGDFLRGSFFLLEFCRKFKIKYNIIIYHPIQQFLLNPTINREIPDSVIDSIEYCEYCNINFDPNSTYNTDTSLLYHEFFNYLNRQDVFNRNLFIYTICYPTHQIHGENKQIIRKIIEPVQEIENNIHHILNQLKLSKKKYIILQIRSGDDYLNKSNNTLTNEYKGKLLPVLKNIVFGKKKPILLVADNLMVKNFVIQHFPFIKTYFKEITHLGENANLNRENIKNTLIDFYIMSYASFIYSISSYDHGSGFSKWCSVTYDIPYRCIKI